MAGFFGRDSYFPAVGFDLSVANWELALIPLAVLVLWVLWMKVVRSEKSPEKAMDFLEAHQAAVISDALSTDDDEVDDDDNEVDDRDSAEVKKKIV